MLPRADLTLLRCQVSSRPWLASATNTNGRTPIAIVERQEALVEALEEQGVSYIAADTTAEEVCTAPGSSGHAH
jgi:hypothetical protein